MSFLDDNIRWLKRGRQRLAVAQVLLKPMTTAEICHEARAIDPHIQLRDIWHLMQQFQEKELVHCLNPKVVTGKLYTLTDDGKTVVEQVFGTTFKTTYQGFDWKKYAWVVRAKIRKIVLLELTRLPEFMPKTATVIRKSLRCRYPVGLNPTLRALKELESMGLIHSQLISTKKPHKVYQLTRIGNAIAQQILE